MLANIQGIQRHIGGWKRDRPDHRDMVHASWMTNQALPASVDLSAICPSVRDQGQIGCHDDKTEVLTEHGWTRWIDYDNKALLGTVNPLTHQLEFQQPVEVQRLEYKGPLYKIDHKSLNFGLTPNHRMFLRPWNQPTCTLRDDYVFKTINDLGWYQGLLASPTGFNGVGLRKIQVGDREYDGSDFVALVALVASDGWVGGTESNWNTVSFCCFRQDRSEMVRAFAYRMGFSEVPSRPGVWKWADADLARWFRSNLYTGECYQASFKRVPDIIKHIDQRQIQLFLRFFGDQHINENNGRQFYSASRRMADDLQELLLKTGKRSGIYDRPQRASTMADGRVIEAGPDSRDITITEWISDDLSISRKKQIDTEPYNGTVFCATVPNSTLITRREGTVLISGNSCTAHGTTEMMESLYRKAGKSDPALSRLFLYWVSRVKIEGTPATDDSGCEIRDVMKALAGWGTCLEDAWPYDTSKFSESPPHEAFVGAHGHKITRYVKCPTLTSIKQAMAAGFTVVGGFSVPESMEGEECARTGDIQYPQPNEAIVGGHCVLFKGYSDASQRLSIQNSWGSDWGNGGSGTLPYQYVTSGLATDFWCLHGEMGVK